MKEINFRGKRIDNGEWVYGAYFNLKHLDGRTHLHHFIIPNNMPIPKEKPIGDIQVEIDIKTLGQYIGVKDKNKDKIYNGDILETWHKRHQKSNFGFENDIVVVQYNWKVAGYLLHFIYDWLGISDNMEDMGSVSNYKIIGNIYENQDLLEVENARS